jgi:hypothetical protein
VKKVSDLIKSALYRAGIRDNLQEVNGDDMSRGLDILNALMPRLETDGMLTTWTEVIAATEDLYILDKQYRPLTYILAFELCAEYQVQPTELLMKFYTDSMSDMLRDAYVSAPNVSDVSHMPSDRIAFDVVSG